MSGERRLAILGAIVQDYVSTSEPVGSKALLTRHDLGVSAATVRNEMAVLEEEGLITAPHTSSGRIPTDAGYRLFVDRLAQVKPLSPAERVAIQRFLDGATDLDDVVQRTVRLLSSLTHQVAVMQYPSLTRSFVRHVELVALSATRLMVVLIATTGRVEQRVLETGTDLTGEEGAGLLNRLRLEINHVLAGTTLSAAPRLVRGLIDQPGTQTGAEEPPTPRTCVLCAVAAALADALVEEREERVAMAGTANLARLGADFPHTIGPVLDALEEHVVLLRLLAAAEEEGTVTVSIGEENPHEAFRSTSLVHAHYSDAGSLGVIGPTRMDYPTAMAHVRAVARYVTTILEG